MNHKTQKLTLSALFIALGIVLPFITGQVPQIGNMLLPMHFPVLLCGFICGWKYAGLIGFMLPYLRYMLVGMPPVFPIGMAMSVELAVYGIVSGLVYEKMNQEKLSSIYISLIVSMISGRVAWAMAQLVLLGMNGQVFTFEMFIASAFVSATIGIVLQLVFIPLLVQLYNRRKVHG